MRTQAPSTVSTPSDPAVRPPAEDGDAPRVGHSGHPLRVLLVEDSPEYARLVERALARAGERIQLDHVETLGAAFLHQKRDPCDVVLLDLGLPDSRPEQTTRHAGRLAQTGSIFVLTGRDDREAALDALSSGVEDYFVKDRLDPTTLEAILRSAVLRRRSGERRALDACLAPEAFRGELRRRIAALAPGGSLAMTVIELDYFDVLRDMWGEAWAQRMLRSASESLVSAARPGTVVALLGGNAFAVLSDGDGPGAVLDQEALASAMALSPDVSHRERYSVTASYGTVRIPEDGRHPASLIACALERARDAFHRSVDGPRFRLDGLDALGG